MPCFSPDFTFNLTCVWWEALKDGQNHRGRRNIISVRRIENCLFIHFSYHLAINQGVIIGEISFLPFVTKGLRNEEKFLGI